jgi:hypothetical protein
MKHQVKKVEVAQAKLRTGPVADGGVKSLAIVNLIVEMLD